MAGGLLRRGAVEVPDGEIVHGLGQLFQSHRLASQVLTAAADPNVLSLNAGALQPQGRVKSSFANDVSAQWINHPGAGHIMDCIVSHTLMAHRHSTKQDTEVSTESK